MKLIDILFKIKNNPTKQGEIPEGTAYAMWSCLCDKNSCDVCKSFEGLSFIPGLENALLPPHPSCNASEGCRCAVVYVMSEEFGAPEIADFIRRNGGKATDGELSKYREEKLAPIREKEKKEKIASDKIHEARQAEIDQPEKSIRLYQESVTLKKEIAEQFPGNWCWRDFSYMYNRITLVLERLGRYEEAIKEIQAYETLPCRDKGIKSDREAIEKRKKRLEKVRI